MSLKSSEIHNCSWRISTVLESFLFSSSSRQTCFPLAIRPMRRMQEMFLKIFLNSPELNCSHLLLDAFVVNDEEDTPLSSILHDRRKNISLVQHQSKFQLDLFLVKSQQVLVFVVLLWPWIGMQNISHPILTHILFELNFGNFCLIVVQIHHKLIWSMRNSDPGVSIVSIQRQIQISTPYLQCK